MTAAPSPRSRFLLCAHAAHCAQVLQAASALRINLHGLQPITSWPENITSPTLVLWALLPATAMAPTNPLEALWRTHMLQGTQGMTIHMLYGSATQQAQQLVPWISQHASADSSASAADCKECLDAASEQKLFQHLLQRA